MRIEQCRSARALLNWSAAELAEAASLGSATVRRFESGQTVQAASIDTMQRALEAAGVLFIETGVTSRKAGFGVRLAEQLGRDRFADRVFTFPSDKDGMKAVDAHVLLLTCPAPMRALQEFGEAIATGSITGTATVIYNRNNIVHEGKDAKLQRYWRRIEAAAEQASVWTTASAKLPASGTTEAVQLTSIMFDDAAVEDFIRAQKPAQPRRGKSRVQDDWTPMWLAAIKLAKIGYLNKATFPHCTDLIDRLHTMMKTSLDEQTIKPFVSKIYNDVAVISVTDLDKALSDEPEEDLEKAE